MSKMTKILTFLLATPWKNCQGPKKWTTFCSLFFRGRKIPQVLRTIFWKNVILGVSKLSKNVKSRFWQFWRFWDFWKSLMSWTTFFSIFVIFCSFFFVIFDVKKSRFLEIRVLEVQKHVFLSFSGFLWFWGIPILELF